MSILDSIPPEFSLFASRFPLLAIEKLPAESSSSAGCWSRSIICRESDRQAIEAPEPAVYYIYSHLPYTAMNFVVLAYTVSERSREIGVRVAVGAEPGQIISLILGAGLRLVFLGMVIGAAGALVLSGFLRSLLFGVGPQDPLTFVVAPALFACVALIAACVPALRAARLDPVDVLRAQ